MTFEQMVRKMCLLRDDPRAKTFMAVASAAKIALDQLNVFVLADYFRSVEVTINDNLTVDFPDDMVDFSKLGVSTDKGLRVLGINPKLLRPNVSTSPTCSCDEVSESTDTSTRCDLCTFHSFYSSSLYLGELYGYRIPQNTEGSFRLDYDNRVIVLGSGTDVEAGGTLILEYKPDLGTDELMRIPNMAFLMIFYKTCEILDQFKRPQAAQAHAFQFKKEYDAYKRIMDKTTPLDIIKSIRGQYTPAPK